MVAELIHKYCALSQSQISMLLGGIDYGAVYLLRRRLRERMVKDPVVQKQWVEIEKEIRDKCKM